jgi:ABC-type glycerol-3-phosphate transport system substrate-binding protein
MGGDGAGGARWKIPGQWVEYAVDVPEAGLYKIIMRARQNIVNGQFVSREITVNGEAPFAEAENIEFPYASDWQMVTPKDQYNSELLYKFNKGENTIRIKAVAGEMTDIINSVEAVVVKLNADYRKILMLTGPSPDLYRDYDFDIEIPEVISDLKAQGDILKSIDDKLVNILGERGQQTAAIYTIFNDLYKMNEKPDYIPKLFSNFKNNITNLGSWLLTAREQPLEIDYIMVAQRDYKIPGAEKGIFAGIWHQLSMFFSSFFTDFNKISGTNAQNYEKKATVWYTGGRDQAQIMRQIIDRSFINQYQIDLNLELVPGGALLPSILAGIGPDVAMGIDSATVINYASRNALQELDDFPNFKEVQQRFSPTAFVPTSLEVEKGKTLHFGLPETQSFSVLFYRKDILEELGKEPPKTWDEVYDLIPVLQKRYMDFAPPDYNTLLYQNGGQLYKNNGQATDIDSEVGIQSFIQQTDFFTNYKLPVTYDFATRFRMGEMPIGLSDYTFCNMLSVFAPEIRGLWSFTTVPGVMQEDGTIKNDVLTGVGSSVMMKSAKNKDNAWEFMKWWTDTQAQVDFGKEIESILGTAARYNSANKEAVYNMPWKAEELEVLMSQWENLIGSPEMPGGYYLSRYLGFAFNNVVVDSKDPRETILDYVKLINEEIRYKRTELGLPVDK